MPNKIIALIIISSMALIGCENETKGSAINKPTSQSNAEEEATMDLELKIAYFEILLENAIELEVLMSENLVKLSSSQINISVDVKEICNLTKIEKEAIRLDADIDEAIAFLDTKIQVLSPQNEDEKPLHTRLTLLKNQLTGFDLIQSAFDLKYKCQ